MRIVSLLPSATELVWALGLTDQLVGRTHECDFPPEVARLPAVTYSLIPKGHTGAEIDALVSRAAHQHRSLYRLDTGLLERLQPDLILTQELCEVCAVAYDEVEQAARSLQLHLEGPTGAAGDPVRIVSLEPMTLDDVLGQLHTVARAAGVEGRAWEVESRLRRRLESVRARSAGLARPRVLCMEWLDPPWCAGHWVPEMVELAGGADTLGLRGRPSRRIGWDEVLDYAPEVLILMPCGYDLAGTLKEWQRLQDGSPPAPGPPGQAPTIPGGVDAARSCGLPPGWDDLPAARSGRIYAVNGSAYFNRPGPRVVDGVEVLAEILYPEVFGTARMGRDWVPVASTASRSG